MSIWAKKTTPRELTERWLGGLGQLVGMEITEMGDDFLKARMPVDERTVQPWDIMHGGASCVLAETLGSIASHLCLEDPKQMAVGQSLSAYHLRPANKGETVFATVKPKHLGRKSHVWEISVCNEAGKLVCEIIFSTAVILTK